ncbi:MAG: TMEM43 family protein, partial [Candidatus Xenobia bacterium]
MADEFVDSQNWFSRLGESITGVLFGLLLVVIAFPLLWWNEGRAVNMERSLKEGASHVHTVSGDKPDPANNGKLVHLTGNASSDQTLKDD